MLAALFAALIDLQGHDDRRVREAATEAAWRLNNALDFRAQVAAGCRSGDAEIRRRCRRVRERYERILPRAGYWPRVHSVAVAGYDLEVRSVMVQFDCVHDHSGQEGFGDTSEYAARDDAACRAASEELARRMLADGYTRWQVLRAMDRAVRAERARGVRPSRFQPEGGWGRCG